MGFLVYFFSLSHPQERGVELDSLDLRKRKEFALEKLSERCKRLTLLQNKLFRKSMDVLKQSVILFAQASKVSELLQKGTEV